METEPGIVAPSFSQGQEAGFDASDFGMDNFPDDDDFPMDDGYDEHVNTDNIDSNSGAPSDMDDIAQNAGHSNVQSASNVVMPFTDNSINSMNPTQGFSSIENTPFPGNSVNSVQGLSSGENTNNSNIFEKEGVGVGNAGSASEDFPMINNYDQDNYKQFGQTGGFPNQNFDTGQSYGDNKLQNVFDSAGGDRSMATQDNIDTGDTENLFTPEDDEFLNQLDGGDNNEGNSAEGDEEYVPNEDEEAVDDDDDEDGDDDDGDESEAEESEEESEDEDIAEALNAANFDTADMGQYDESRESLHTPDLSLPPDDNVPSTSEQNTEETTEKPEKKKRKRKKKGDNTGEGEEKPKRKRKKKGEKTEGEDGEKKKQDNNARKNIRKILSENKLEQETLDAQNAELERQRRLQELKKQQLASLLRVSPEKEIKKEKDSQLKSLLQAAEEEAEKEDQKPEIKEEKKDVKTKKDGAVIDISSGDDDEDVVMVNNSEDDDEDDEGSDEEFAEAEDVNNSGSHINDIYNVCDDQGRVLVNVGHPTADPDIYLSSIVARHIKPHQIGGVRFLYDNLVECLNRFKTSAGFGCILAHSMGLGKTIQMIGFVDIFLRHTEAKTVMVIVPINTLANWMSEFNMWVPDKETCEKYNLPEDVIPRPYDVYMLNDLYKNTPARAKVVETWYRTGGVLLLGYEMYRLLSSKKVHLQKGTKGRRKTPGSDVIDVEEEDRDKKLLLNISEALVNPGPDLVVCDEGHRIKNSHAGISQSLKQIKTKRRIVLTGYPLQNNLIEYWCMVDFVRPNFLGTKTEFCNMFERPIMNGQCADSTPQDVRLMRYRAHVLHSLLEGFVQRRGHTVLQAALPPKEEYVFLVRMSPVQQKLYEKFMESVTDQAANGWVNNNPLKAFSVCCKIWNHPDILYTCMKKSLDDNDLDIETGEPKKKGRGRTKKETPPATPSGPSIPEGAAPVPPPPGAYPGVGPTLNLGRQNEPSITYDWANDILKDYVPGMLDNGGKMVILFTLIQKSLEAGDKILVFSQSLFTLNLIEEFLSKCKVPRPELDEYWCKNKNYFRLDGSTSASEREKLINQFNAEPNKWVFLLSTRAGSLGINLIGANRVVVVDASWNPCHDCQAICRVYRFGQTKPSYIYRLVTENTMEKKIYDRQVNKQGMSDRVVDELNPQNQFRREQVDKLMHHTNKEYPLPDFSTCEEDYNDACMVTMLKNQGHWLTSKPFSHESLLIDRKELKLTMREKRAAKQSYVMEKRLNVSYSRPSYAAYYPRGAQPYQGAIRGRGGIIQRPIASVKPMVSTPVPMRPKIVAAPQVLKPGVSVHQVLTTTEITLPGTNTTTEAGTSEPKKIPAGQQVLVIRTPKGVYIRTPDGKIFAVRSKPQPDSTSPLDALANTGSNLTTGGVTIVQPTTTSTMSTGATGSKLPTGVTVIRPKPSVISTTKPLTIIRQGPGQVRTIIPVTIGTKITTGTTGTTAGQIATISAQSQKVTAALSGSKIKIVAPNTAIATSNTTKVKTLAALQNLAESKKMSVSLTTVGANPVVPTVNTALTPTVPSLKTIPTPVVSVMSKVSDTEKSAEQKDEVKMDTSTSDIPTTVKPSENKDTSWNLPPIDIKALQLPQQLGSQRKGKKASDKPKTSRASKSPKVKTTISNQLSSMLANSPGDKASKGKIKPQFSLSSSPSDSNQSSSQSPISEMISSSQNLPQMPFQAGNLSTRPSDIDLHEMKLTSNPNSTNDFSQMMHTGNQNQSMWPGNQAMSMSNNQQMNQSDFQNNQPNFQTNQSSVPPNQSSKQNQSSNQANSGFHQQNQPSQKVQPAPVSRPNTGIFNPGLPDNISGTNNTKSNTSSLSQGQNQRQGQGQMGHSQMFSSSQGGQAMFGNDFGGNNFMNMTGNMSQTPSYASQNQVFPTQNSNFGTTSHVSAQPNMVAPNMSTPVSNMSVPTSMSAPGFNMTTQSHQPTQSSDSNSNSMADFTMSGIHNNSSFLSELTDADDNFLSQLDGGGSEHNSQNSQSSMDSGAQMTQSEAVSSLQTDTMGSQASSNMAMSNFQQPGGMNFDMFSNQQQQQNPNFFPNFGGNNQFNRNANFGNQQNVNMSQGGFPGGSMYPMGGMMQPSMFPYPAFAPYPYPPYPMPYYPMPFQPQYSGQTNTMGPGTGNMGQQVPNMTPQAGTNMGQVGAGNMGQVGSGMSQPGNMLGMPVGQPGDNNFPSGMGN